MPQIGLPQLVKVLDKLRTDYYFINGIFQIFMRTLLKLRDDIVSYTGKTNFAGLKVLLKESFQLHREKKGWQAWSKAKEGLTMLIKRG